MLYLIITYVAGMCICNGLAFEENQTINMENEKDFTAMQKILQDLMYLGVKSENISKEVEQFVNFYTLNLNNFMEHQYKGNEYKMMLVQISQSRHCFALKNNFEMLTSHINVILQHCYERVQFHLNSLLDKATRLRKAIMNEIAKWATNDTRQEQYSTAPLPILLRVARVSARNISTNAITATIDYFNMVIERFEIAKKLTQLETNLNAKLCGIVANTYEEEIQTLFNALKGCIMQVLFTTSTSASLNTSEENNFNQDIKKA